MSYFRSDGSTLKRKFCPVWEASRGINYLVFKNSSILTDSGKATIGTDSWLSKTLFRGKAKAESIVKASTVES